MRRIGLPQPPSHARRRLASRVVPGLICVAAALLLTGCAGSGGAPTATGGTITPSSEPTSASTSGTAPSTPTGSTPVQPPAAQGGSGVEGTTVTERCPVVTPEGCPKYPLTTHVIVASATRAVAAVDTGADGRFRIALSPGVYTIKATAMPAGITRPATTTITVVAGRWASLTLELDSGIR